MPHDSLYVHVMGGMWWGHRFQLHQVGADFVGRYLHYTDWGYPANYEVTLRRIDCQSRSWDKGGPKMKLRFGPEGPPAPALRPYARDVPLTIVR